MIEKAVLVVMLIVNGTYIHHVGVIDNWGYLNQSYCLYRAHTLKQIWGQVAGAEIINIGCPYQTGSREKLE